MMDGTKWHIVAILTSKGRKGEIPVFFNPLCEMAIDDNAARNRVLVRTSWISTVGKAVLSAAKITG